MERPVLLAVDQQLGEGTALRLAPELADPLCSLEVREHEDVEELGASSRRQGRRDELAAARARLGASSVGCFRSLHAG
jgi:hypothetical protein